MANCKYCATECVFRGKDKESGCGSYISAKTNADLIRGLPDEELAKMFMDFSEKLLNECGVVAEAKTTEYVLEWLKQPAEK